jgi:H/ACA ribonucleoprotein complex subunit 3
MASVLLKRCTSCKEYTLKDACPRCGAKAKPNRPAKFSPEDNYGEYRRKLKRLDRSEREAERAASPRADPKKGA